jgi:hypothetical protein
MEGSIALVLPLLGVFVLHLELREQGAELPCRLMSILEPEVAGFYTSDFNVSRLIGVGQVHVDFLNYGSFDQLGVSPISHGEIFLDETISLREVTQVGIITKASHQRHQVVEVLSSV